MASKSEYAAARLALRKASGDFDKSLAANAAKIQRVETLLDNWIDRSIKAAKNVAAYRRRLAALNAARRKMLDETPNRKENP